MSILGSVSLKPENAPEVKDERLDRAVALLEKSKATLEGIAQSLTAFRAQPLTRETVVLACDKMAYDIGDFLSKGGRGD